MHVLEEHLAVDVCDSEAARITFGPQLFRRTHVEMINEPES
jgi:hypothetical protein